MAAQNMFIILSSFWFIFLCVSGNERINVAKREVALRHKARHRRWSTNIDNDCFPPNPKPGSATHSALTKDKVKVQFLIFKNNYKVARVTWDIPKGVTSTVIFLSRKYQLTPYSCMVVENKTSIDIGPSSGWKSDETLEMTIVPLPMPTKFSATILKFRPNFVLAPEPPTRPPTTNTRTSGPTTRQNTTLVSATGLTTEGISDGNQKKSNVKIVIGSVTGVAMGILLIVIVVIYKKKTATKEQPPLCEDYYYVSCCPESKAVMKKVEEFISWSRENSFDVQMDTMLSPSNELRRREIGPFSFGEVALSEAKNVFMMVSPAYLALCEMEQNESRKKKRDNLSQEETIVCNEIVHIRNVLYTTMFRSDRFIPILLGVKETQLPYWMKELVLYSWPEDASKLLYRLYNLPEYTPGQNNTAFL